MLRARSRGEIGFQVVVNLLLFVVLAAVLIPLWRVLMMSLTPLELSGKEGFALFLSPAQWTFEAYRQLLGQASFIRATSNSILITTSGTALNLLLTVPLAYALSVRTLPGRKFVIGFVLLTYLFQAGMIPTYLVVSKLGLINKLTAVILPSAVNVTNVLIMRNFFEGLPEDLKEAARLDGAGELEVLTRVVLPLSLPILLTIGLYYAVGHWNEFFAPILYLSDAKLMPLPVLLRNILQSYGLNEYVEYNAYSESSLESLKAASVFLTMLPMMVIYPFIQRYFTKGTLLGGVKE